MEPQSFLTLRKWRLDSMTSTPNRCDGVLFCFKFSLTYSICKCVKVVKMWPSLTPHVLLSHLGEHGNFMWIQSSPRERLCSSGNRVLFYSALKKKIMCSKTNFRAVNNHTLVSLQRSLFRTFLMYGFHFLVWFFCVKGIKDTQCGFKLFTREAALKTFSSLHVERW